MHARALSPHSESPSRPYRNGVALYDAPVYLHTSTFRSGNLELSIRSPRVEHVEVDPKFVGQSIPVFTGKDSVGGTVITAIPAVISAQHQLVISIEGAFFWIGPQKEALETLPLPSPLPERIKHVFLSSSVTVPLSPSALSSPLGTSMTIRSVLQNGIHNTLFRRTKHGRTRRMGTAGLQNDNAEPRGPDSGKSFHSFAFPLPVIDDREIPSTISVSRLCPGGLRGRWYAEGAQIAYKLTARVQPIATEDATTLEEQLEAPIFIESKSIEEFGTHSSSWSHSELTCLKHINFKCMLSLPKPASFLRSDAISFFLFFTTSPKSDTLARKIVKDASIRVTLIRQLRLDSALAVAISAPVPRTRHSDEMRQTKRHGISRAGGLLRRVATTTPKIFKWNRPRGDEPGSSASRMRNHGSSLQDKPLPTLPTESSSLYEDVICSVTSEGFPKRVSHKDKRSLSHEWGPGPDGVFKGELRLSNELSNTINWPGISLSYFVEATVFYDNHVVQTRHGVRLVEDYV